MARFRCSFDRLIGRELKQLSTGSIAQCVALENFVWRSVNLLPLLAMRARKRLALTDASSRDSRRYLIYARTRVCAGNERSSREKKAEAQPIFPSLTKQRKGGREMKKLLRSTFATLVVSGFLALAPPMYARGGHGGHGGHGGGHGGHAMRSGGAHGKGAHHVGRERHGGRAFQAARGHRVGRGYYTARGYRGGGRYYAGRGYNWNRGGNWGGSSWYPYYGYSRFGYYGSGYGYPYYGTGYYGYRSSWYYPYGYYYAPYPYGYPLNLSISFGFNGY